MTKTAKQKLGSWGEEQACSFLVRQGYQILDRNFRIRTGEIDIIAYDKDVLCFVEVKTRNYGEGSAERATDRAKISKIKQTALQYCFKNNIDIDRTMIRFEQVSVYVNRSKKTIKLLKSTVTV